MAQFRASRFTLALMAGALVCSTLPAAAQERFPSRPIVLIMPTPPGGGTDILGRQLAKAAEKHLGQQIVVDNKPGGNGTIGIGQLVQSKPDGYTIGAIWSGAVTTTPHTMQLPYDLDALVPLLQIGAGSYVVCARDDFPANSAKELIDLVKANPDKYTLGNDGIGNTMQLAAQRIFGHFGAKLRQVPFNGAGETARNFLGGHVDLYGGSIPAILAHVKAGKVKCLLLTSADDNPTLLQASGLRSLGVPELETVLWWGLSLPRGVPADRVAILRDAFRKAADSETYRETLSKLGATPTFRDGEELKQYIGAEYAALGNVAQELGLKKSN
jgi:tripartite-type tricarboxylate transporter receptor subunit TctC